MFCFVCNMCKMRICVKNKQTNKQTKKGCVLISKNTSILKIPKYFLLVVVWGVFCFFLIVCQHMEFKVENFVTKDRNRWHEFFRNLGSVRLNCDVTSTLSHFLLTEVWKDVFMMNTVAN